MLLIRPLLQPELSSFGSRPRKRPLAVCYHDLVDAELDLQLDGREDSLIRSFECFRADCWLDARTEP
jgi:hypothetical protein